MRKARGFTLVEVLIVVVLLGILSIHAHGLADPMHVGLAADPVRQLPRLGQRRQQNGHQ